MLQGDNESEPALDITQTEPIVQGEASSTSQ